MTVLLSFRKVKGIYGVKIDLSADVSLRISLAFLNILSSSIYAG